MRTGLIRAQWLERTGVRAWILLWAFALLALLPLLIALSPEIQIPLWGRAHQATAAVSIHQLSWKTAPGWGARPEPGCCSFG